MCCDMQKFCFCMSVEVAAQVISIISTFLSLLVSVVYTAGTGCCRQSAVRQTFYVTVALAAFAQVLTGGLLAIAAFKGRPRLMWPWILVHGASGLLLLAVSVSGAATLVVSGYMTTDASIVSAVYVVYSLILLYCTCVVNSRRVELMRQEMEAKNEEQASALMYYPAAWKYT